MWPHDVSYATLSPDGLTRERFVFRIDDHFRVSLSDYTVATRKRRMERCVWTVIKRWSCNNKASTNCPEPTVGSGMRGSAVAHFRSLVEFEPEAAIAKATGASQ